MGGQSRQPQGGAQMIIALFWLLVLALFTLSTYIGNRLRLIPIISQLLVATFRLPLLPPISRLHRTLTTLQDLARRPYANP